jgi:hypothetical protein
MLLEREKQTQKHFFFLRFGGVAKVAIIAKLM